MRKLALTLAGLASFGFGAALGGCAEECPVGAEGCACTGGGGCDLGLTCLSMTCVNAGPNAVDDAGDDVGDEDEDEGENSSDDSSSDTEGATTGPKLDSMQDGDEGEPCDSGCKKVDMLFALDGSLSMIEEINALKATSAFLGIVETLEALNCGGIEYRIGVTGDDDNGWVVPNGWSDQNPWFDSETYSPSEIATHFQNAATIVGNSGGAALGCEHVLTTALNLLGNDDSQFMRDDALLVLVFMSDVDDYGEYDQLGGNTCGVGCNFGGQQVSVLYDTLVALKDGDPAGVSTIVIAGDPSVDAGENICGQPQSCASAFHADRLYEFAGLQTGTNGFTADICSGANSVPQAVQAALTDNIDLACQEFTPEG
ncbi:hypothetical protein G6O69_31155 [Pseudenhygromyxa sp. WMMC2535]|uniref:hypothetical protein n=1 Tax=Pseudenhygromyxa sp. WMMC2535 TaxID=2712867 RepID=UPI001552C653|nr:hypothetical protein [Pseudenhygromyxa sp. WMMC2535]NVB42322.1 hypothetical protein [Pseudenhygromyxa sp. WMMC2535]